MNILDIIVWLALAVAVFNGWRKGFIGKLFSLAGLVGGIWLALGYGARCGEALHMEGTTAAVAGPIVVFVAAAVAANLVGRLVSKACSTIGLGGLDTLLGIALALLQAVLLLGLAFKATDYFDPELIARSTREESKCYAPVMCVADKTVSMPLPAVKKTCGLQPTTAFTILLLPKDTTSGQWTRCAPSTPSVIRCSPAFC